MYHIKKFDFISHKAQFTFNELGDIRIKTVVGGLLCLFSIIISLSFIFYLFYKLIFKEDASIIFSTEKDNKINLLYSYKLPFMLRLSDTYSIPLLQNNLYNISLLVWYTRYDNKTNRYIQDFNQIIVEKCNIEKHFSDYKDLFYNTIDLENYYCPRIREKNQSLSGIYGENKPFSYYLFYFSKCVNNTNENENNCLPDSEIEKLLSDCYLDIKYVTYLDPKKSNYGEIIIKSDRFLVSSTIYKRIWLYFNYVRYKIDHGIFFPSYINNEYHQYENSRIDIDLRNKSLNDIEGTFLTVTILTSGNIYNYKKRYLKIQDYLATIGGIVKAIVYITYLLNYYNSSNSYYTELIRDYIIENQINKKNYKIEAILNQKNSRNKNKGNSSQNINKNLNFPIALSPSKSVKNYIQNSNSFMIDKIKKKSVFEKKYKFKFLPLFFTLNYNDKKDFEWKNKIINRKLNIITVLNQLEFIEKLKKEIDNEYNFQTNNYNYNQISQVGSNTIMNQNSLSNYSKNNSNQNNLNNSSSLRIIPESENDTKNGNILLQSYVGKRSNILEKINNLKKK